jgi:hypothetical protein
VEKKSKKRFTNLELICKLYSGIGGSLRSTIQQGATEFFPFSFLSHQIWNWTLLALTLLVWGCRGPCQQNPGVEPGETWMKVRARSITRPPDRADG